MLALRAVASVLPTRNDDALLLYLFSPRLIAAAHGIAFQPAVLHNGLLPQQVEIHWAALFAVSNETAVTVWDFLCALGTLGTVYVLARVVTADRGVALVAVLVLATSPAFTLLMGAGKPDDAGAQFGICAFAFTLWASARPREEVRATLSGSFASVWMARNGTRRCNSSTRSSAWIASRPTLWCRRTWRAMAA